MKLGRGQLGKSSS